MYGELSVDLWYWLTHSLAKYVQPGPAWQSFKPPAIIWIGQFFVPLRHLFGSVEMSLLFSILLTQFALLLILFKIGGIISKENRLIAASGMVFAAGAQQFAGLSHEYFVEPLQAVAVAWAFLIALKTPEWPKTRTFPHIAANIAFGLLVKASTPAYCLLPWLYCLFLMLRTRNQISTSSEWKARSSRIFLFATCAIVLLCGYWYLLHLKDVWQHVYESALGEVSLDYGTKDTIVNKLGLWLLIMGRTLVSPFLVWAGIAILGVTAYSVLRGGLAQWKQVLRSPVVLLSIFQIAVMLLLFSMSINTDARYIYALLPCVAILFMVIGAAIPRGALLVLLLLCGVRWVMVNQESFVTKPTRTTKMKPENQWVSLTAPHRDNTEFEELARVVHVTSIPSDRMNMVAVEYPWLNSESARFFAAKERLSTGVECIYTSAGYAQKDLDVAMRRIEDFHVSYVITVAKDLQDTNVNYSYINVVSRGMLERIEHDNLFTPVPFESNKGVLLYRLGFKVFDITAVPSQIAQAKIEQRGSASLDYANNALAKQVSNKRSFFANGGTISPCTGWAYDELLKSTPEEVWLELTHTRTGKHYYWPAERSDRPQLAAAEKIPTIVRSGYSCKNVNYMLPAGTYTTKIYQVAGGVAIVSALNRYESSPVIVVQ